MPNNKKQRGREEKKKKIEAQKKITKAAGEQQAQLEAEALRVQQERAIKRAEVEESLRLTHLQGLFGTPAIDDIITDIGRSSLSTAAAAAAAPKPSLSSSAAEKQKENDMCYHGSLAEYFIAGSAYLELVKSYVSLNKKYDDYNECYDAENKFYNDKGYKKVMIDGDFTIFVFAVAVSLYSKLSSEERERYYALTREEKKVTATYELQNVIRMGLNIKYIVVPSVDNTQSQQERFIYREKGMKYIRDINTERGRIKCLHRETKQYCGCMATNYNDIKGMSKMERCYRCRQEFPKELMKKCDGCEVVVYCSKACCSNDWPCHQISCKPEQKYLAANTKDNTVFAHSSATNATINTTTATTTSIINAASTIEEASEKAATRKKRILKNANERMNYVNGKNVQDEVDDKTSTSNAAARIRAARQRRYGKKTASSVTSVFTETTTIKNTSSDEGFTTTAFLDRGPCFQQHNHNNVIRKDDGHEDGDDGDGGCSGGGGKTEY